MMIVRAWYLGEVLYPPLAAFVRTSIAVFLLHIAVEKWHVWVIRLNIVIIWILSIVYFFRTSSLPRPVLKLALGSNTAFGRHRRASRRPRQAKAPERHLTERTPWTDPLLNFLVMTMQCSPPSYFWRGPIDPTVQGSCLHQDVVPISTIVYSAISAVSDWMLALLPIAMLWHVRINLQTKIGVAILLGMGIL